MTQYIRGIAKSVIFYFFVFLCTSHASETNNGSILDSSAVDNDFYLSWQYCQIAVEALSGIYKNETYRQGALKNCRDAQKATVDYRKEYSITWASIIKEHDFNGYIFFLKKGAREYSAAALNEITIIFLKEAGKTIPKKLVVEFIDRYKAHSYKSGFLYFINAIHLCEGIVLEKNTKECAKTIEYLVAGEMQHYATAKYYYAWMFQNGVGVVKDQQKAQIIMESINKINDMARVVSDIQLFRMEETKAAEENKTSGENMDKTGIINVFFRMMRNLYGFGVK